MKQIRERDERLFRVIEGVNSMVTTAMKGEMLEKASGVTSSLVTRLGFLKTAILDLAEAGNLYATHVIFRVYLEHMLRVLAIFLKTSDERSDAFAEQYLRLQVTEAFEYLQAHKIAGLETRVEPRSALEEWFPEAKLLSDKEVRTLANPFRYRNLIQTIRNLIGATSPDFLSKIIPNYSELSGFVHGGPTAVAVMKYFDNDSLRANELSRIAELTVGMFYSAERWLLMLASAVRPEFQQYHDRLAEAMRLEQ